MAFDLGQIVNLVGQLGGDHSQALQKLQGLGGQVDPQQHGGLLQELGIDPGRLAGGGYQQHLDAQQQPGFQGYQSGDMSGQTPQFGGQGGMGQGQGGMGQGDQNYQQFDQRQGGMRGMDPDQQLGEDDMAQQSGRGSGGQGYDDLQDR
jgi:hypothetical protein